KGQLDIGKAFEFNLEIEALRLFVVGRGFARGGFQSGNVAQQLGAVQRSIAGRDYGSSGSLAGMRVILASYEALDDEVGATVRRVCHRLCASAARSECLPDFLSLVEHRLDRGFSDLAGV